MIISLYSKMNRQTKIWLISLFPLLFCTAPFSAGARPFKNTSGTVIDAEIKAVLGDQVTIVRSSDKQEFTIPIASLAPEDQAFVNSWTKPAAPGEPSSPLDERIKPGARFSIDFPDLTPDRHGNPASVGVQVPTQYDPAKPTPLFVWMGGGEGGNSPGTQGLVDGDRFITIGLPFPKGANNPNQANMVGDFKTIWTEFHEPMLAKLFQTFPNIDKRLCILGGFSNGAHCIAGVLQEAKDGGYPACFNCFILVDGGSGDRRLKGGKGNFLFATWGETSPNAARTEEAAKKASGMEVQSFEMKGTGHQFGPTGKEKAKAWLDQVVIPATLKN